MNDPGELVAKAANATLSLADARLRDEHFYASVPLCIIDAVFSIGVNYIGTKNTVIRWANAHLPIWPVDRRVAEREHSVSEFIEMLCPMTDQELAEGPFGNRQRTSSRNGILKAKAVRLFALALQEAGIEVFADVEDQTKLERADSLVSKIPGQRSGISFDYFALLAGNDLVKADRMVCRFVATAVGVASVEPQFAKVAVIRATALLKPRFQHLSVRLLDSEIWSYESQRAATQKRKRSAARSALSRQNVCGTVSAA